MSGTDGRDLSPLASIEATVQERARRISLDLAQDDARSELRRLVDDEVRRWSEEHRRGLRAIPLHDPDLVADRAFRNLAGYGPLEPLLADDDVWEIMVNDPATIFVKRHRGASGYHHEAFHDDAHVQRVVGKILDDATTAHRKLDPAEGLQDAQLDGGARMHIVHGDIARGGHLQVNIRKFTGVAFRSLAELVEREMLTRQAAAFLTAAVRAGLTVVVAGAPGSGKTTLMSCCASELDPALRIVTAEEVFECDVALPNVASMQTRAARPDRPGVDLRRLVAGFLRMAPDVAVVGEVRDREALPLLLTLSTGIQGFTTIHAASARAALTRLRLVCQLSPDANDLPVAAVTSLVSEAVDIVVHCARDTAGPRVSSICAVEDQTSADGMTFTTTEVFGRAVRGADLRWTGNLPARAGARLAESGVDVRHLLGATT
ncbi:MAG: Flp pilus assembly complex ATPase component TadA [Acidimicrobiales bacterium]|nr:Flp pilus assembly complex ATPase component TadA [Acidimicrobiales bacterium]